SETDRPGGSTMPLDCTPPDQPRADGLDRRGFLTLAVAGVAASALTVTIGTLNPTAAYASVAGAAEASLAVAPRKRELRAMWISSVVNIDWPSRTGLSAADQQAEFLHWLDVAEHFRL